MQFLFVLAALLSVVVATDYQLELLLVSYSSPDHITYGGYTCYSNGDACNNQFSISVNWGSGQQQRKKTGVYWNNDNITFGDTVGENLNNPLVYQIPGTAFLVSVNIFGGHVQGGGTTTVFSKQTGSLSMAVGQEYTLVTVRSRYNTGRPKVFSFRYRVVCMPHYSADSDCLTCATNYYRPNCSVECIPKNNSDGHYVCNQIDGSKICIPGYYGPNCSDYCVPSDSSSGHYTCNQTDGSKVCMPGYGGKNCTKGFTVGITTISGTPEGGTFVCSVDLKGGSGFPIFHWYSLDKHLITNGVTGTPLTSTFTPKLTTTGTVEYTCRATIAGVTQEATVSASVQIIQIQIGPVTKCSSWNDTKTKQFQADITQKLAEVISAHCDCSFKFPKNLQPGGNLRCWVTNTEVTYRRAMVSFGNGSMEFEYIENWFWSENPFVTVDNIDLKVYQDCPLLISSMNDLECQGTQYNGPSVVTSSDPLVIDCLNHCLTEQGKIPLCFSP